MLKRVLEKIAYLLSVLFLLVSIYFSTFGNEQFSYKSFIGTDGLTLYGSILALLTLLSLRLTQIRKIVRKILLISNISDFNYHMKAKIENIKDIEVAVILDSMIHELEKIDSASAEYDLNNKSPLQIKCFFRGLAANVIITKVFNNMNEYGSSLYSFEINGVSKFRRMDKNINFLVMSVLEELKKQSFEIKSLHLNIARKSSEANIMTDGLIFDRKNNKIISSNIIIECNDDSSITLNNNDGINLDSSNSIKFLSAYQVVQDLLIS